MIIPENNFSPVAITLSLSDIGIDTEKVLDTTAEIGGVLLISFIFLSRTRTSFFLRLRI